MVDCVGQRIEMFERFMHHHGGVTVTGSLLMSVDQFEAWDSKLPVLILVGMPVMKAGAFIIMKGHKQVLVPGLSQRS
jgi:hypothetical protein